MDNCLDCGKEIVRDSGICKTCGKMCAKNPDFYRVVIFDEVGMMFIGGSAFESLNEQEKQEFLSGNYFFLRSCSLECWLEMLADDHRVMFMPEGSIFEHLLECHGIKELYDKYPVGN